MAQRPVWRGHLRLALVSCPIALYAAERSTSDLHFHLINPATGNRVRMVTLDAGTEEPVSRGDLVKGFEVRKDNYVLLDDEDFERARIDSSSTMTIGKFVDADAIDPIYFDRSYYAAPDGDSGSDVYVVLRDAIRKSGRVALSRLVIARRERPVALMPMDRGLVVHTLHEARDLHSAHDLFADVPRDKPDAEMVSLATELITRQLDEFQPADTEDRYEARLREVIEAKAKGQGETVTAEAPRESGNVIDLMAALRKSLGQAEPASREQKPARKPVKPAAKRAAPAPKPALKPASKPVRKRA